MLKECTDLVIPIKCQYGCFNLYIVPSSERDKLYIDENSYADNTVYQLVESSNYQYEFDKIGDHTFQFKEESEIVKFSTFKSHQNMGSIKTGIYVGQLSLPVCERITLDEVSVVKLEIRSVKSDYETDYRHMLDDIAEYYTDLVLMQGSPVKQQLEVDDSCSSQTLYQKFSFIRSIIDSDAFRESINKIISNPVRKWTETTVQRNIISVRRLSRKNIRQIASSGDRVPVSQSMWNGKSYNLSSLPRNIDVDYKKDSIDNHENQFIKFALMSFSMFCTELRDKKNASERLKSEIERTLTHLTSYLDSIFFRQVSMPTHLNLNSPVLQRKEGYREVLQVWLMFDFAARLNWTGGNLVYEAGQKNVAVLYEYWLFFKLQELISEFFRLDPADKCKLVSFDDDSIDLNLIQGRTTILRGVSESNVRNLNIAFYYNRTFSKPAENRDPIHTAGSWTMAMRPDYTLSIWPGEITEEEAERQELITHIHFDAKYRLNKVLLEDPVGKDVSEELNKEKVQQELGIYKRADLLKMHAYKDAIRRTSGAYVLYPGTQTREVKGFHEVIPGLGAFSIRPGHWSHDSVYLKQFLSDVKAHMYDRTSQREKMSFYQYDIYATENQSCLRESLPEPVGDNRDFMPDETQVIVAFYKDEKHLQWILQNHMYNMRAGMDAGSVHVDINLISARYLLLHNGKQTTHFIKIRKDGPKIFTREQLIKKGYPKYIKHLKNLGTDVEIVDEDRERTEAARIYWVFDLYKNNTVEKELQNYQWNIQDIVPVKICKLPQTKKLSDLISKKLV